MMRTVCVRRLRTVFIASCRQRNIVRPGLNCSQVSSQCGNSFWFSCVTYGFGLQQLFPQAPESFQIKTETPFSKVSQKGRNKNESDDHLFFFLSAELWIHTMTCTFEVYSNCPVRTAVMLVCEQCLLLLLEKADPRSGYTLMRPLQAHSKKILLFKVLTLHLNECSNILPCFILNSILFKFFSIFLTYWASFPTTKQCQIDLHVVDMSTVIHAEVKDTINATGR